MTTTARSLFADVRDTACHPAVLLVKTCAMRKSCETGGPTRWHDLRAYGWSRLVHASALTGLQRGSCVDSLGDVFGGGWRVGGPAWYGRQLASGRRLNFGRVRGVPSICSKTLVCRFGGSSPFHPRTIADPPRTLLVIPTLPSPFSHAPSHPAGGSSPFHPRPLDP